MICEKCGKPKIQLFISFVCDFCDKKVQEEQKKQDRYFSCTHKGYRNCIYKLVEIESESKILVCVLVKGNPDLAPKHPPYYRFFLEATVEIFDFDVMQS